MNDPDDALRIDGAGRLVDRAIVAQWVEMYEKTGNAIWAWRALLVWLDALSPVEPLPPTLHRYLKKCIGAIEVGLVSPAQRRALNLESLQQGSRAGFKKSSKGHSSATELLIAMGLWQKGGAPMAQRYLTNVEDDRRVLFWRLLMESMQRREDGAPATKKAAYVVAAKKWKMTPGSVEQFVRKKEESGALPRQGRRPIRSPRGME